MNNESQLDKSELQPEAQHQTQWEFGNLLDAEAQTELHEFYSALEMSQACKTVLVGYTPPRD